ncbi:MAG: Arm DNA-binding domain-containing protein [Gammaproteobacteria bacterium]
MGRITKTQLDHLEPPESGYALHWDSLIHGFGVRVTAAGAKSFILQTRIHAKQKRITLGGYGALTVEQARRQARRLLGEIAAGHDPIAERKRKQLQSVTLAKR